MKYLWLLISIVAVVAGTVSGELSRKISYGWVESKDASLQVLGAGGADLRCMAGQCRVCFDSASVPQLRENVCHSTPGAMVLQPFVASAVTTSVLLAFWLLRRRWTEKTSVPPTPRA
jgi:spore maturation protein SpmA